MSVKVVVSGYVCAVDIHINKGVFMRVKVSVSTAIGYAGLAELAAVWQKEYPEATLEAINAYGRFDLTLLLPAATVVVQPQLVDLRASSVS